MPQGSRTAGSSSDAAGATVVIALSALAFTLLGVTPAQAAVPTYTTGDEWGLWTTVHTVTLSCDAGDRRVGFEVTHGREFIKKIRKTRTGVALTLRTGDPETYDSAVGARITCKDLA